MSEARRHEFYFSVDILKSSGITADELKERIDLLGSFLGPNLKHVVPDRVNDIATLGWIVTLSRSLEKLSKCKGFAAHAGLYTDANTARSAADVALLAAFLKDNVDDLTLEPGDDAAGRHQDIGVTKNGHWVLIEYKTLDWPKDNCDQEHQRMFNILSSFVQVPHQVDVFYDQAMSDEELTGLGKTLQHRLQHVTASGQIISNEKLRVGVQIRGGDMVKSPLVVVVSGISEDTRVHSFRPMHVYMSAGKTMSINGPLIDNSPILIGRMAKARAQCPEKQPFILVVNCNAVLGNWQDNIRRVETAFQPDRNTRFSAVVLLRYSNTMGTKDFHLGFDYIGNPFARNPVADPIRRLFM